MWGSIACVYVADVVEVDNVCLGLRVFTLQVRANFKSGSVSTSVRVRMRVCMPATGKGQRFI